MFELNMALFVLPNGDGVGGAPPKPPDAGAPNGDGLGAGVPCAPKGDGFVGAGDILLTKGVAKPFKGVEVLPPKVD